MPGLVDLKHLAAVQRIKVQVDDWFDRGYCKSFSQEGEDMILARYFERRSSGFYVDVGAHDPRRFSNTLLLYRLGWRGINIDATPGSMRRFRSARPRDINLEVAVGPTTGRATLTVFDEPALNTLDDATAQVHVSAGYTVRDRRLIEVRTLASILHEHVPQGQGIELFSVDVEGLDLEVLKSNDWSRFQPEVIAVESLRTAADRDKDTDVYLEAKGYRCFARTMNTCLYESRPRPGRG